MNPQTEENLDEYRLQKLFTEIDSDDLEITPLPILPTTNLSGAGIFDYIAKTIVKTINWFWYLPGLAKLLVAGVVFVLGFAILQAALKLIASVISMALLFGLVYLGYNFFVAGNSSQIKE